jgi:hypothetical protein
MDPVIYKAVKKIAIDYDTTVSSMVRKALLLYISDPEGIEETVDLLMDKKVIEAIRKGEEAREQGRDDYYLDWNKIRDL